MSKGFFVENLAQIASCIEYSPFTEILIGIASEISSHTPLETFQELLQEILLAFFKKPVSKFLKINNTTQRTPLANIS